MAGDDDSCGAAGGGDKISFHATGGTTYYVQVGGDTSGFDFGFGGAEGTFTLAWSHTPDAAPVVTTQPVDLTVTAGQTASFTAAASGQPAPSVQWQKSSDGGSTFADIAGATSGTYSFTASLADNGAKYRAVFTNRAGSATSTPATLTVQSAPVITQRPADLTVLAGQTATFTAAAVGNPSPTVQWIKSTDGGSTFNAIAGATSTTLSFTAAAGDSGSMYRATFTNSLGSATTAPATLTVNVAPSVTTNPASSTVNAGQTATFTAAASGQPSPTVRWQKSTDGGETFSDIPSATSTTLSFVAAASDDGSRYRAIFTNAAGSATTTAATLTVHSPPAITSGTATTFTYSAPGSFTVTTTGNPTPSLSKSGSLPSGVTFTDNGNGTATLAGTPASGTAGSYSLTITASNSVSPNATQSFTLTVEKAGTTTGAVTSSANPSIVGQPVTFSATVAKVAPATATPVGTVDFYDGATKIGSGTLNASGIATFQTSALAIGSHPITARYLGNGDFGESQSASALTQNVTYGIRLLYGPRTKYVSGSTIPIKVSLINFAGQNISTASQVLTVIGVTPSPGGAGPTGTFAFSSRLDKTGGYQYDLKTTGYAKGSYKLLFTVSGDPITHEAPFVIG